MTNHKIKESVRLVAHVKPVRYNLVLKPDLEAFTFSGKETIDILIDKSINEITLHSKDIEIETVELIYDKQVQFANRIVYNKKAGTATFKFKSKIRKGKAKLSIIFEGIINDSLVGFYRSRYTINGESKYLVTTQFESTDARRAFPCFDEPAHKAIFDVSLIIPGEHTAISNTLPKTIKEHEAGYKIVEFASTPRMSTYLLAFIIGQFEYVEGQTKNKVGVRVFTTAGKKHQAKFALEIAIKSLDFYEKYFGIPYPLPVLDLIAIPDFESGAMENWGAVTFRETAILVDEEHSSLSNKQWVAIVIAHEIAHQWFGNLVTMEWWTHLWLNEGFADYILNLCIDYIFPSWNIWDLYLAGRYAVALKLDSLSNSHPIEVEVHHPDEISEIFDMISYAKGSAVIRQLSEYLGHVKFRDGLRHYLKKHSYKNTVTDDLWKSFEKVSGKPVKKIMNNWTGKTGYPVITLSKKNNKYQAHQRRFFSSRISRKVDKEKTLWQIPLQYKSSNKIIKTLVESKNFSLTGQSIGKLNIGESSFIRVMYDKETLERLKIELSQGKLSVRDRLAIIRDLFALAEGGYIKTTEAMEFALFYKDENEYIVWSEIASGINRLYNIIANEPFADKYKSYALSLFGPLAKQVGWETRQDEIYSKIFLRSLALGQASFYGDKDVIKKSKKIFTNINKKSLPPDIRDVVYRAIAANGNEKDWKRFEKLYINERLHEEQERYGHALAKFTNEKLLLRTLRFALSKNVRTQDAPFMIAQVWRNHKGRDLAWRFVKNNWSKITEKYNGSRSLISRMLSSLGGHTKSKDADSAKIFFKNNPILGSKRTLEQAYESIYSNSAWLASDKKDIKAWLMKNY